MKRSLGLVLGTTLATVLLTTSPALAEQASIDDDAGDAANGGLDITSVTVRNLDHAVVAKVRFVASVRGDLIVSIDPRGDQGVRMVSEYRPVGHTNNLVIPGAFTDRGPGDGVAGECRGLRVRWSAEEPTATLRMPSRCLADGNYGAIRFAVLTERGADTDFAPETPRGDGSSAWISRG
jgi:hypothetical protein